MSAEARETQVAAAAPPYRPDNGLRSAGGGMIKVQIGPKAVGSFLPKLTQKAFERFGFPAAALLTEWEAIVGRDLASYTRPERLKWPRRRNQEDADLGESDIVANVPAGATMVLRVDGPRSIEVQLRKELLLERVNAYFGFRAVVDLRFIQAPVGLRPLSRPLPAAAAPRAALDLKAIGNPRLKAALERLGRSVEARDVAARKAGPSTNRKA